MFGKKGQNKLEKYIDPTGEFTNRELKAAEWYVVHKLLLKKIGYALIIVWCVVTVGYSFGYWAYYFGFGYWQDERIAAQQTVEFQNYTNLQALYRPRELSLGRTEIYNSVSSELFDLVVDAANPNDRYLAGVAYKFVYGGGETEVMRTVILPGVKRPIAYLGLKADSYPSGARLVIEEIKWLRLNPHYYSNIPSFMGERLVFKAENFKFTSASRTQGLLNHMLEFDLHNGSAYGFWEANFYLDLLDNGERVGVMFLPVDKIQAGETKQIDLRSYVSGLRVTDITLVPLVNIFEREIYLPV